MPLLVALLALIAAAAVPARADPAYGFDLPKAHPDAYRALRALFPDGAAKEDWLYRMDGTSGPLQATGDGRLSGYVCRPHDCMDNKLVFVVSPDGSRVAALLRSDLLTGGTEKVLGKPEGDDLPALRKAAGID